jgi:hypothetical protein
MILFVNYGIVMLLIFYMYFRENKILNIMMTDLKLRKKANQRKSEINSEMKLVVFWPVLLIREAYNEIKKRRQS